MENFKVSYINFTTNNRILKKSNMCHFWKHEGKYHSISNHNDTQKNPHNFRKIGYMQYSLFPAHYKFGYNLVSRN